MKAGMNCLPQRFLCSKKSYLVLAFILCLGCAAADAPPAGRRGLPRGQGQWPHPQQPRKFKSIIAAAVIIIKR